MVEFSIFVRHFLMLYLLPFLYGAATRLPFIYYVIHLRRHFGMEWFPIGLCVASYQGARVLTNLMSIRLPQVSHIIGTITGLVGYLMVLVSDNDDVLPFVIGTSMVGFSETVSSMQIYCKNEFTQDVTHLQRQLKLQYASVMLGVTLAFLIGGVVYQMAEINGVACFGSAVLLIELVGTILLFVLSSAPQKDGNSRAPTPPASQTPARTDSGTDTSSKEPNLKRTNSYLAGEHGASWLAYIIALSIGMEAVTIGYNLSVGPLFLLEEFDQDVTIIGTLFSAGATTGTLVSILVTLTPWCKRVMTRYIPVPYNIYVAMAGIGCSVLLAAIPSLEAHITGLLLLMGFNDLAATLLTEMQGSITSRKAYKTVGPFGQIVRRSLNTITALTGPSLYSLFPRAPHLVAGGVTLLWTAVVIVACETRRVQNLAITAENLDAKEHQAVVAMPFEKQEMIAQMLRSPNGLQEWKENRDNYLDEISLPNGDPESPPRCSSFEARLTPNKV